MAEDEFETEGMRACPHYARGGKCSSGCWDEPHCITDEPVGGWDEDKRAARSYLEALLAPSVAAGALLDREGN